MKHEAQPAECVVSYPNFQDFASYTSWSTNIGFFNVSEKCSYNEADQICAVMLFGSTAKKCASARATQLVQKY